MGGSRPKQFFTVFFLLLTFMGGSLKETVKIIIENMENDTEKDLREMGATQSNMKVISRKEFEIRRKAI